SYAAFYPPSWLVLALPPAQALSLLVVLHAGIAFAGAFHLARRLGCSRAAAALAALGYTGSGASLSLISAFTLFCSMAWFPWFLAWGDAALGATVWRPRSTAALWAGGALALQLLNGEPATVLVSGLGLLCLALPRLASALRSGGPERRTALAGLLAAAALPVAVALALA